MPSTDRRINKFSILQNVAEFFRGNTVSIAVQFYQSLSIPHNRVCTLCPMELAVENSAYHKRRYQNFITMLHEVSSMHAKAC